MALINRLIENYLTNPLGAGDTKELLWKKTLVAVVLKNGRVEVVVTEEINVERSRLR